MIPIEFALHLVGFMLSLVMMYILLRKLDFDYGQFFKPSDLKCLYDIKRSLIIKIRRNLTREEVVAYNISKEAPDEIKASVVDSPSVDQALIPANPEFYKGICIYDKVSEIKKSIETSWCDKGLTLSELGQFEDALDSYDRALEINPNPPRLLKVKLAFSTG